MISFHYVSSKTNQRLTSVYNGLSKYKAIISISKWNVKYAVINTPRN